MVFSRLAVSAVGAAICVFVGSWGLARLEAPLPLFYGLAGILWLAVLLATAAPWSERLTRSSELTKPVLRPEAVPLMAEENIEEYVCVPHLAGGDEGEFVLHVEGDSMKDAGILCGDYVVIHPQETAQDGDIVVAMVGEDVTVKRFFREGDHIRLQPENGAMEPIRSDDVRVLGRVVGQFRNVS